MSTQGRVLSVAVVAGVAAALCQAQSVMPAHSGTLHYFEGDVSIDGATVQPQKARFQEIKEQGVLRTGLGRAEILLTPGVFLRVGENSAIKLLDNRLVSTRVEVLSGTVIVESDDPQLSVKDSPVTLIYKDYDIQMLRHGVFEISSDPAQVKVYKGEALVTTADNRVNVKEGHLVPFGAALLAEKFDEKTGDDLLLWTRDRSQSLSAASMSSARSIYSGSGYLGSSPYGLGGGLWSNGWYYNSFLGMYTFVPAGGAFFNPWGYGFFSPGSVYNYYVPTTYWYGGGGSRGTGVTGRPVIVAGNPSSNRAAPLSNIRGTSAGNNSMPALGSPLRGGNAIGVPAAASNGDFAAASRGGGSLAAASSGGSSSGFASAGARGSAGGASAGGGGGSRGGGGGGARGR